MPLYSPPSATAIYTWAAKPLANAVPTGTAIRISDFGLSPGLLVVSDGTRWIPSGVQVLARSAAAVAVPADTTEDTLASISVPAGLLGVNGFVRITAAATATSNANTKTLRVRFGGTAYLTFAMTTNLMVRTQMEIANRNSASSQFGGVYLTAGSVVTNSATSSIDTTAAVTILLSGQKAASGDTFTLESYLIEVGG